jgi:hypothetical protein
VAGSKRQSEDELSARVIHTVFRDYIKHEDTLVQYRVTWLLVLTGMLLTLYLTLCGLLLYVIAAAPKARTEAALVDYPVTSLLFVPIFLLSLGGLIAAVVCFRSILGAAASAKSIQAAWRSFKTSQYWKESDNLLPEVTFGFSRPITPTYGYPKAVCIVVALLWMVSIAANLFLVSFLGLARAHLVGA